MNELHLRSECLWSAMHAQPFRPFTLLLADGRKLRVGSPDWIAYRAGGRMVLLLGDDGLAEVLELNQVVALL